MYVVFRAGIPRAYMPETWENSTFALSALLLSLGRQAKNCFYIIRTPPSLGGRMRFYRNKARREQSG